MSSTKRNTGWLYLIAAWLFIALSVSSVWSQKSNKKLTKQALATMEKATRYLDESFVIIEDRILNIIHNYASGIDESACFITTCNTIHSGGKSKN